MDYQEDKLGDSPNRPVPIRSLAASLAHTDISYWRWESNVLTVKCPICGSGLDIPAGVNVIPVPLEGTDKDGLFYAPLRHNENNPDAKRVGQCDFYGWVKLINFHPITNTLILQGFFDLNRYNEAEELQLKLGYGDIPERCFRIDHVNNVMPYTLSKNVGCWGFAGDRIDVRCPKCHEIFQPFYGFRQEVTDNGIFKHSVRHHECEWHGYIKLLHYKEHNETRILEEAKSETRAVVNADKLNTLNRYQDIAEAFIIFSKYHAQNENTPTVLVMDHEKLGRVIVTGPKKALVINLDRERLLQLGWIEGESRFYYRMDYP